MAETPLFRLQISNALVDGNRTCIWLLRYHLLHLLANNTGTVAVIATARTSARPDKTCLPNRLRVIPERSAVNPCLPSPGGSGRGGNLPSERQLGREALRQRASRHFRDAVFKFQHRWMRTFSRFEGPRGQPLNPSFQMQKEIIQKSKTFQNFQKSTWKTTASDTGHDIRKG